MFFFAKRSGYHYFGDVLLGDGNLVVSFNQAGHKVCIYKEYHSVCPPRRNWDSPTPSLASECAPPPETKGGGPAGEGLGESPHLSPTPSLTPLSHPLSRQRVCPSPRGGGHTRLRVRGCGSPNSDDGRKSLALCTLCDCIQSYHALSGNLIWCDAHL